MRFDGSVSFTFQSGNGISTTSVFLLSSSQGFLTTSMGFDSGVAFTLELSDLVTTAFVFSFGFGKGLLTSGVIFFKGVALLFHFVVLLVPLGTLLAKLFDLSVILLVISLSSS